MSSNYPTGFDTFPTDVDNVTLAVSADQNNRAASLVAMQKYSAPVVNIVAFGAKGDNSTDNSAAWTAAVAALPASGGTIFFPASANSYNFASAWSPGGKAFIRVVGASSTRGGGSATASLVRFTGTTGPLVAFSGLAGMELRDLYIQWPAAFTGTVVDMSGSEGACLRGCFFAANGGGANAAVIAGFDNSNRSLVDNCRFHNAVIGVQGLATAGHFCVGMVIRDCNFNSSTGDIATACISNPHQNWLITGNVFEMGQGAGNVSAITTPLSSGPGVTFAGNWTGDQGTTASTQINAGNGWLIAGNYLGGKSTTTCIAIPNNASGITIQGNEFDTHSVAISVGTTVNNLFIGANDRQSVTTYVSGTPNSGAYVLTNGTQTFYGAASFTSAVALSAGLQRSTQTPSETTLVSGVNANGGEHVSVTLSAARVVGAPTSPTTGQHLYFTLIQNGTGGFAVTWNAVFKVSWSDTGNTANKRSTIGFWYDGTSWNQIAAQTAYV